MAGADGYGFTYNPGFMGAESGAGTRPGAGAGSDSGANGPAGTPTQLFAWQICLAHLVENALEDADNYPDYLVNRDRITQALGLGMAQGQNAFSLDDQLFVAAVSIQNAQGEITIINESHPHYADVAVVVAEQLLRGEDHGMVALLPNGSLVPFLPR